MRAALRRPGALATFDPSAAQEALKMAKEGGEMIANPHASKAERK